MPGRTSPVRARPAVPVDAAVQRPPCSSVVDEHLERPGSASNPLLPWIADRSWFREALPDGAFRFATPDGRPATGCFPEPLVRAWIDENPGALGGRVDPETLESDGAESLALQIDEVLTLDRPGLAIERFGLRRRPGSPVEWFEHWQTVGSAPAAIAGPWEEAHPLRWVAERPRGGMGT